LTIDPAVYQQVKNQKAVVLQQTQNQRKPHPITRKKGIVSLGDRDFFQIIIEVNSSFSDLTVEPDKIYQVQNPEREMKIRS
jgi:hypothetical protein